MTKFRSPLGDKNQPKETKTHFFVSDESPENFDKSGMEPMSEEDVQNEFGMFFNKLKNNPEPEIREAPKKSKDLPKGAVELSVEDFKKYQALKENLKKEQSKLSTSARSRVEQLIGLRRKYKDCDIDGTIFSLRTLKSNEVKESTVNAFVACKTGLTSEYSFEVRYHILARAVVSIDGCPIEAFLGTDDMDEKLNLMYQLSEDVIKDLYKDYLSLLPKSENNQANAEETVGEIKK